jgi:hypothetical protein
LGRFGNGGVSSLLFRFGVRFPEAPYLHKAGEILFLEETMKTRKKPWEYMNVTANKDFPVVTREQKKFKLPWRVAGKGLKSRLT